MADLLATIEAARRGGDLAPLLDAIPFVRYLGLELERDGGGIRTRMDPAPHLVGNAMVGALHGGTIGSLLESAAVFDLLLAPEASGVPKIIGLTIEYLRSARVAVTWARAEVTRQGRRIATVRVFAWQDDPGRPVAAATVHFLLPQQ